jgi:hypothetical protein
MVFISRSRLIRVLPCFPKEYYFVFKEFYKNNLYRFY